ncbi:hypothetical protein ANN_27943 [Periplaneta americana]|uniref:C2H2-type domain-containing protein n=1 Tax=Periplaneta americana TaxID=6978 RepID=A0ABQ8RVU9_PERAM|nr:hypothetical protein ANN_27943 [Periplaneta americana]
MTRFYRNKYQDLWEESCAVKQEQLSDVSVQDDDLAERSVQVECRDVDSLLGAAHKCGVCNQHCDDLEDHECTRPFKCDVCDKRFRNKKNVKVHMGCHTVHVRIHTGEKPFNCAVCNKDFRNKRDIYVHMRSHTGENPFTCKFCGRGFRYSNHLKVHVRIHTGEKPFKCDTCGKVFRNSYNLKTNLYFAYQQNMI